MDIDAVLNNSLLKGWLNQKYLKEDNLYRLRKEFLSGSPFQHLEIKDLFLPKKAKALLEVLAEEPFDLKESDLFKFMQTAELSVSKNPLIREFHSFLSSPGFTSFISFITQEALSKKVDLFGSVYQDTDFLLPHDDLLESRKIAFSYYLSDRQKADGGSLHFFSSQNNLPMKVKKKVVPRFNSFVIFLVSPVSFHEVEECYNDLQRIAMTGWFHA